MKRLAFTFIAFIIAYQAHADTPYFPSFNLWPQNGSSPYTFTSASETLSKFQYSADLFTDFSFHPIRQRFLPSTDARSVVDYTVTHFLTETVAFTNFWQIGFTIPFFSIARFEDPSAAVPGPGARNVTRIGDIQFSTKLKLLDNQHKPLGLSLEPFFTLPSGTEDAFLGEASASGGFKIILDKWIHHKIQMSVNLGSDFRKQKVHINNVDFQNRFMGSMGMAVTLPKHFILSLEGHVATAYDHFFSKKQTTPLQIVSGLRWRSENTGLVLGVGGGTCTVCGVQAPVGRLFVNIGYHPQ